MRVALPAPRESLVAAGSLWRCGLVRPYRLDHLVRTGLSALRYGMGPAAGPMIGAVVYPDATGIVDDSGSVSMRQLDQRCSAVADRLHTSGFRAGDTIGILMRNSAAFYEVMVGASRLGLDVTYVNTGSAADQVARLATGQPLTGLVCDLEFAERVPSWVRQIATIGEAPDGTPSVAVMAAERPGSPRWPARSSRQSRHVIPTSGTTGEPTYVARTAGGVESVIALLSGLPFRVRETHLVAAPLFHAWGWLNILLTMLLSSTVVVTRRFDPKATLALIEREHCHALIAVPTMLRRIMDLPASVRRRFDTSSLSVVAVSGSALSPSLAGAFMDEFGEILFSMYGSTEAGYATVATPVDMRDAPGTAGRALPTVRVRVVDEHRRDRPTGQCGSILVSSRDAVARSTKGARWATVDTGDVGRLDEAGRLFIAGRTDEMVIVGGENVYPVEVEHTLEEHPDIVEAAVVGAPDREFGQILVAHVVTRRGASVTAAGIRQWCRGRLASFQVPRRVVVHTRLPHGETGKLAKRSLAE